MMTGVGSSNSARHEFVIALFWYPSSLAGLANIVEEVYKYTR